MWFGNPFGSNKSNVTTLLQGMAKQEQQTKQSTTVDVWRGNYSDYQQPKPRLTIMKRSASTSDIAVTKTLPADRVESTPRTLLCHHATDKSGHVKCSFPGKCNQHKLAKPSSFEVSRIDQCRSVIDLYDQSVMPGVIAAQQQISRNNLGYNYEQTEYPAKSRCVTHTACGGTCATHRKPVTTTTSKTIKGAGTSIRAAPKQLTTTVDQRLSATKQVYSARSPPAARKVTHKACDMGQKKVTFNNEVMVKCINPHCGRTSVTGMNCGAANPPPEPPAPPPPPPPPPAPPVSCNTKMPACYYQHMRERMARLKQKEEDAKQYAPPSSLATGLVKKYNSAKNNCVRRKKFVIPVIDPDCLYLPNNRKVSIKPRPQRPIPPPAPRPQSAPPARRPRPKSACTAKSSNPRNVYPRRRTGVARQNSTDTLVAELDRRAGLKRSKSMTSMVHMESIPIGCDVDGPLIYSVSGGKVVKISRMQAVDQCDVHKNCDQSWVET